MFVNLSSANASLLLPHLSSSNSSLRPSSASCFKFRLNFFIFTSFAITNILLLLPLCVLILHLGLQRWLKQRSASTTAATTSHSDVFTYHVVAMEMIGIFGCFLYFCGVFVDVPWLGMLGMSFFTVATNGQIFFHILTCVERHLAVVHPIIYLGLRNRGGVRIRNVTICCAWLLVLGSFGLTTSAFNTTPFVVLAVFSIAVVSFCSLSVLRSLIRPGPGDGDSDPGRVDQSKIRAFHTIIAIMAALLLRLGGHLLALVIYSSSAVSERVRCGMLVSGVWFCLPSSLVLPLLFLHRAGKLLCCKSNTESGQGSE